MVFRALLSLIFFSIHGDHFCSMSGLGATQSSFPRILKSLSKEIAASVIYINTTRDLWLDLKERFAQSNRPRIFQIQKSISTLS